MRAGFSGLLLAAALAVGGAQGQEASAPVDAPAPAASGEATTGADGADGADTAADAPAAAGEDGAAAAPEGSATAGAAADGAASAEAPTADAEAGAVAGTAAPPAELPPGARETVEQLDPATIDRVITVLENEADRQRLLDTLRAVAAVEQAETAAKPTSLVTKPVGWLQSEIDRRVQAVEQSIAAVANSTTRFEQLVSWLQREVGNPARRAFWLETLSEIGATLGIGLVLALALRRLLRDTRARFDSYRPPTPVHVAGAILAHAVVRLVPIGLFVGGAALVALALELGAYTAAVTRSLVEGLAFVTALTAVMRAVFNVRNPHMRLFPVPDETGLAIQRSAIRVLAVGGYGYFALQAARALGLPWTVHGFLEHILFFVTFLLYVRLILRFRRLGADGLRALAAEGKGGVVSRFLPWSSVARGWHWIAILFGFAIYGSWALHIAGGPAFLFRALGITLVLLFFTRLVNVWLTSRAIDRKSERAPEEEEEEEVADVIASAARTPMSFVLRLATTVVALLLILQAWGVDVWGWLQSEAAASARDALLAAGLTVAIAYGVWTVVNRLIRGAIEETDNLGRPVRSSRSQTLLTIGRNFAFVLIWLTAGMLALSELGVNLAPLLAGAGVIGLAIGFGSQQLVQDIITGFFILLEDTISVGDVADLGGKVGVVEAVTLRIVRLRGYDGQMHTIPYSKISTISNLTKDFSYYVFDVRVAYKENVDRVMEVMAEVGAQMQRERAYRRLIVEPLEVAGVDRFDYDGVIIRARLKTRPLQQWVVGREYNRRLKNRFDELGIEIPFPQRMLHVATPAAAAPLAGAARAPTPATLAPDEAAVNAADSR